MGRGTQLPAEGIGARALRPDSRRLALQSRVRSNLSPNPSLTHARASSDPVSRPLVGSRALPVPCAGCRAARAMLALFCAGFPTRFSPPEPSPPAIAAVSGLPVASLKFRLREGQIWPDRLLNSLSLGQKKLPHPRPAAALQRTD
ncbi:uncharacterized protein VTP21DRAFT_2068 [Calcarisporiella thermophila]|uniref:uncharacterized protein n=1 Tax=Calcarisporiella thermophila TaxID=911321 RepID=UPI003743CB6D